MGKSPSFQFYPSDFLSDKNTLVMSAEEIGAYCLLLFVCWDEGSLNDDIEELAAISRMPVEKFQVSWEKRIKRCFFQNKDGFWVHQRLEKERLKQQEWKEKSSQGGKKSAEKKWSKNGDKDGVRVVTDCLQPNDNQMVTLQSSCTFLEESTKELFTGDIASLCQPDAGNLSPPNPIPKPPPKQKTNPDTTPPEFRQPLETAWLSVAGETDGRRIASQRTAIKRIWQRGIAATEALECFQFLRAAKWSTGKYKFPKVEWHLVESLYSTWREGRITNDYLAQTPQPAKTPEQVREDQRRANIRRIT